MSAEGARIVRGGNAKCPREVRGMSEEENSPEREYSSSSRRTEENGSWGDGVSAFACTHTCKGKALTSRDSASIGEDGGRTGREGGVTEAVKLRVYVCVCERDEGVHQGLWLS
ncbi:hypothetical protein FQA47_011376 [Oryzias melastigma]|uniref:Uncharacterized protein n=1 Tax=Oryzias melastigma TaxID=30732 RepID=A0A834CFH1_ORYME|nr:hypothetical protein FQA47_011376 [Oryzias melastigma]